MKKSSFNKISAYQLAVCGLFTALIAVGAFVKIPFPVVPITLQTLFVILSALILGAKYSSVSVAVYLFIGLAGLPVFTRGGGIGYVFQPTFGYLLGFLFAAPLVGTLSKKITAAKGSHLLYYWGAGLSGIVIVYLSGMLYMYFIMNYYMKTPVGFLSFLSFTFSLTVIGDIFKCLVAALLAARLIPILQKSARYRDL